jgi:hypothetical protein
MTARCGICVPILVFSILHGATDQPQRGCGIWGESSRNPVGVEIRFSRPPRVARKLATLGWRTQSLWDCVRRNRAVVGNTRLPAKGRTVVRCSAHLGQVSSTGPGARWLWYARPAVKWTEALPIGNGRLGAMVFGGISDEHIQFNEDTLWTGRPHDCANTNALKYLPRIRELIAAGKNKEAGQLAKTIFLGSPSRQKAYQPFGDLRLHLLTGHQRRPGQTLYKRS